MPSNGDGPQRDGEVSIDRLPNETCAFILIPSSPQSEFDLTYYEQLRKYVQHEDYLINFRLTWSLTIHGFLLAAYGFTFQKLDVVINGEHAMRLYAIALFIFQALLAFLGCLVALGSHLGVHAALRAIGLIDVIARAGRLKLSRLKPSNPDIVWKPDIVFLPRIIGGGASHPHKAATIFFNLITIPFIFAWLILFIFTVGLGFITSRENSVQATTTTTHAKRRTSVAAPTRGAQSGGMTSTK